jgi:hypothetical protein
MEPTLSGRIALVSGIVLAALAAQTGAGAAPEPAKVSDPWQPIRGLLGSWEGDAKGDLGSGKCEREYRLTLRDRFIQVR